MKKQLVVALFSILLVACGETVEEIISVEDVVEAQEETAERVEKAQMVFQTVPSPLEIASIFQDSETDYNAGLLNPITNVDNYATNIQKAINFGVYGADLSYANIFDQTQETMFYMNCSKKLSDGLGITSAFDALTMERLEENMSNRDSLMIIINDAFWSADVYLKENGQDNLSALIITGGWIEGLYIGSMTLDHENPDEELMKKIASQKFSLDNLVALLSTYEGEEIATLTKKLESLKVIYDNIAENDDKNSIENEEEIVEIGEGKFLSFEKTTIIEIAKEVEKIRNEII